MSKQHKITYNGKKYVTTFSKEFCTCKDCIFWGVNLCKYAETKKDVKCHANKNKDGRDRIWVEDKSVAKKDDHAWLIEYYDDVAKDWFIWTAKKTRKSARVSSSILVAKTRIRKFVLAK